MSTNDRRQVAHRQSPCGAQSASPPSGLTAKPPFLIGEAVVTAGALSLVLGVVAAGLWMLPECRRLSAEAAQARRQVIEIVNQPITHLARSSQVGLFPYWFHPGAIKPDFDKVDVRDTQEFTYDAYSYVTSDLNPSEMFIGKELEFNSMTKFFYVDRSLPKKKLSQSEMLEINRLYRIMGREERASAIRWKILAGLAISLFVVAVVTHLLFPARHREGAPP